MEKPILFMLKPWFDNGNKGPFYCPDCGIVEGFFTYNPKIADLIEVVQLDFERPREKIIAVLGAENQGSPCLVIGPGDPNVQGAKKSLSTGKIFIDDPLLICEFLAEKFGGILPHPQ